MFINKIIDINRKFNKKLSLGFTFILTVTTVFFVFRGLRDDKGRICPESYDSSFTLKSLPPTTVMRDAVVIVGALRTGNECIPRLLRAFSPSETPLDVFCVLSIPNASSPKLQGTSLRLCNITFYRYDNDDNNINPNTILPRFPYDRIGNENIFPSAFNILRQFTLWKNAWQLIEEQENRSGILYRSITRFRPDTFLSSQVKIDRDSWSSERNWMKPRSSFIYATSGNMKAPLIIPNVANNFLVLTSTDEWAFPFTDQVAFGDRTTMKWYFTAIESIESLPNVHFYPEFLLRDVMLFKTKQSATPNTPGVLRIYVPTKFISCICRHEPCGADCILGRHYPSSMNDHFRSFICPDEEKTGLIFGKILSR